MGQQMAHGDVADAGADPGEVGRRGVFEHPLVGELRQVARDRVVEAEAALLPQHHDRRARDGPRHRVQPEQVVAGHRVARLSVALAERLEVHDAAVAGRRRHHPGDVRRVDAGLKGRGGFGEAARRHADRFGLGRRERLGARGGILRRTESECRADCRRGRLGAGRRRGGEEEDGGRGESKVHRVLPRGGIQGRAPHPIIISRRCARSPGRPGRAARRRRAGSRWLVEYEGGEWC